MTKEKLKMIQVDEFVHRKIKELAASKGLSVKEFMCQVVNGLLNEDRSKIKDKFIFDFITELNLKSNCGYEYALTEFLGLVESNLIDYELDTPQYWVEECMSNWNAN